MLGERTALVTGASRGIGRAIALELARKGAKVGINFKGNKQAAEETLALIEAAGGTGLLLPGDISDAEGCVDMVKSFIEGFGRFDILVNNAGITRDGLLLRMKKEDWEAVLETNLTGVYNCTKAGLKYLLKSDNGCIINITSVVGQIGNPGQCNYSAAKAGVIGFTKSLARELAGKGVRVNAVAPGFIDTDMTAALSPKIKERMLVDIPLGRFGTAEEVAGAAAFLASPEARYITGQILNVDGGMVMI